MKSELLRIAVHAAFYPALWFNRALCAIGIWEQSAWVTPNLAIGSLPSAGDLRRMAAEGVTAVVNMCEEYGGNVTLLASLGVGQLHLPTLDYHCPSEPHLLSGIPYIRDRLAEGGKVLVHCKAGRGRSAIMILCYLMAERRISAAAALEILRRARPQHARGIEKLETVRRIEAMIHRGELPFVPVAFPGGGLPAATRYESGRER